METTEHKTSRFEIKDRFNGTFPELNGVDYKTMTKAQQTASVVALLLQQLDSEVRTSRENVLRDVESDFPSQSFAVDHMATLVAASAVRGEILSAVDRARNASPDDLDSMIAQIRVEILWSIARGTITTDAAGLKIMSLRINTARACGFLD